MPSAETVSRRREWLTMSKDAKKLVKCGPKSLNLGFGKMEVTGDLEKRPLGGVLVVKV